MDTRQVKEFEHQTRSVYLEVFKALNWPSFSIGVVLLLCLHFIGTALHNWMSHVLYWPEGWVAWAMLVLLVVLFLLVKRNPPRFEVELREAKHTACQALILPFSPPASKAGGDCLLVVEEIIQHAGASMITDAALRNRFGGSPWRVPVESIAYQMDRKDPALKVIVLLASTKTAEYQSTFEQMIQSLCGKNVQVVHVTSLGPEFQGGVDYFDPKQLSDALVAVNQFLKKRNIPDSDVMFDVTGGTSLVSVLCTAAAYRRGRRIQYVLGIPGERYQIKIWEPVYLGPGVHSTE